jgi:CRP/FNR family cyclic AMP-dependent transcriptional regulator
VIKPQLIRAMPDIERFVDYCERETFRPKALIIKAGAVSESLYLILEGSVTVLLEGDEDHEMVASYLNPGDFIGEMGLFSKLDEEPRCAAIRAKSTCEVAHISYIKFHQVRSQFPDIAFTIAHQMADRLRHTNRKLSDLAFVDVSGRVARTVMELCEQPDAITHPDGMQIKVTRQEIGRLVGCSREMAGRVLKNLEDEGLLEAHGKTIVVYGTR